MQAFLKTSEKISLEAQWRKWSEKHPDKYGKHNLKLIAQISNRMYFVIIYSKEVSEFWLGTKSHVVNHTRVETKLSGLFETDYMGTCTGDICEWRHKIINYVKEVYKNQDLSVILDEILNSYKRFKNVKTLPLSLDSNEEVKRVRLAYSVWITTPKVFSITVSSTSEWNITIRIQDRSVNVSLKFMPSNTQGETYARVRVIEPRMETSNYISFGGLLQYKSVTPCTGTKNYLDKLLNNLYKAVIACVVDQKYTLPYGNEEYIASLSRFDNCTVDTLKYKVELNTKFIAAHAPLPSARDKRRALQNPKITTKVENYIASCDVVGVSEVVFDSKSIGRKQPYLYVKITTELGINGYYRTVPVKSLYSKSILMNDSQLINLGIACSLSSRTKYVSVEYNPVILEPSRTVVIRKRYIYDTSDDKLLEYISNNIKVLCTGHVCSFTLHKKLHYFDVIDAGNDKCSTLQVTSDTNVTIDILEAPLPKRKNALSLSPSAYDSVEES